MPATVDCGLIPGPETMSGTWSRKYLASEWRKGGKERSLKLRGNGDSCDLDIVLVDLALAGRHAVLALPAGFLLARLEEC